MELRHLEYFLVVADELSFSRAAERLNMSQPPLSTQIRALEKEMGVELFVRSTRKVALTEAGELFRASTRRLLAQLQDNVDRARSAALGEVGQLALGFVPSATTELLPPILRAFRSRYPGVRLALHELRPDQQVQELRSGSLDCACFYLPHGDEPPFGDAGLTSLAVSQEPLVVALPSDHHLAAKRRLSMQVLGTEPFVMVSGHRGSGLRDAILEQCRRGGIVPEVVQDAALIQTIAGLVATGVGVALLPASVRRLQQTGVVYRPLTEDPLEVRMGLIWLEESRSPIVEGFIRVAREVGTCEFDDVG
ncbi:LysR substrate-binding domain-containing protein [Amycolatopsis japonica]|uniref:LysR substrate-binding domain-containing protein n=1 Tax=Amycolatopsis japonica TaxID=208439 RepID=UPI00366AD2E4